MTESKTYPWVGESIGCKVALTVVELRPQDTPLISITHLKAAACSPDATATAAQLVKVHQELEIWRVQCAAA